MSYIDSVNVGGTSYKIQETVYITPSLSSSAYTADLSNFTLATGATVQAKFATTNPANATLNVNGTGAKEIHYNGAKITASQFKVNHVYTLVYDGTQWQVVGDIDTNSNTWRGIQDNLTSDSTTDSLSAKQGKILKGLIDAMDATTPAADGNATAFIDSITQTDGKITSITKKNIPTASTSTAGIIKIGTTANDAAAGNHNHDSTYSYIHLTDYSFTATKPLSKYVTFDKSSPEGAPATAWYNGFISSHNNYLASYIINEHRTANWYVGYGQFNTSTNTAPAPTWYLLAHSGNVDTGDDNGQVKIAGQNVSVKGLKALAYKDSLTASDIPNLSWNKITSDKPDYTTRWPTWDEVTSKPSSFNPSSHTHSYITSRGNITNETEGNKPAQAGLSMSNAYNNGYPVTYGNVLTMYGSGASQLLIGWSGSSSSSKGVREESYIRSQRDTTGSLWSAWEKILTSGNTTAPSNVPTLSWDAESTIFTLGGTAVKVKAMAKPSYTWSDISSKPETATRWPKWNEISQSGAESIYEGSSDVTDNTEILTSYASNNGFADTNGKGIVYRRDAIHIYNYINGKLGTMAHETASNYAKLDSPAFTGTPKSVTPSSTSDNKMIATKEYVDGIVAANDAMVYKGVKAGAATSSSNAYGALTPAANCGDTYKISTAGFINGLRVEVGDMLICTADNTAAATSSNYTTIRNNWNIIQTSEGSVSSSSTSSLDNALAVWDSTSGRIIKNQSYVTYLNHTAASAGTNKVGAIDGIQITGSAYGEAANLISNTDGQMSYGDAGPQIRFNSGSQLGALIFNHYDNSSGMGASFHFVTNQGEAAVKAHGLIARTRAMIGGNSVNTNYNLYVNGTSYLNGTTQIGANLRLWSDNEGGNIRFYKNNDSNNCTEIDRQTDALRIYRSTNGGSAATHQWLFLDTGNFKVSDGQIKDKNGLVSFVQNDTVISNTTDWNGLMIPGCYKVQMSAWGDAATYHSPNEAQSSLYSYGLLFVIRGAENDSEKRTLQIYFPHRTDNAHPIYCRMANGSEPGWQTWHRLTRGNFDTSVLTSGTLTTGRGGTGVNSHTANRLVWSTSATTLQAGYHYANTTKIAINSASEPSYNLYVNGTSYLNGDTTINGNLIFPAANILDWNSDTYRQRIVITDDSTTNTAVFTFQQSTDSGSSYTNLFTIKDNGTVVATTFDGNATNADTVDNLHASDFVRAYTTTNDNIDSDWGQSFKTFDPIPSGTPPAQNPNISTINIGNNFNRRKQFALTYSTDDIYYRRRVDGVWKSWVHLLHDGNTYAANANGSDVTVTCGTSTTLATINGTAVKITVTKPTYSASDVGAIATSAGVTAVAWDKDNKKITRTINDSAADVVQFVAGDNITLTGAAGKLTIKATDTTYSSLAAASGGTAVSLVTTGEKYTWNQKLSSHGPSYGKITVSAQSTSTTALTSQSAATTPAAKSANETLKFTTANKWIIATGTESTTAGSDEIKIAHLVPSSISNSGPTTNQTPGYGATFNIPKITLDEAGHVTSIDTVTVKIPASDNTNTATATDNILDGSNSGTAITYAPYSAQQTKLSFDTSTNAPTRTDRLNLNGSLYATTYNVAGYVTLQWNSTDSSLDFVFA